ncbi:sulfotransferase [Synechococcus sp. CBW1006]|uniref:sulfotransferase n=1 Tax=Synechococcus sp. CBW1006 TaxID=1353138 RepID=UPI001E28D8DB|nr:sulfotransferase [Synechococcus sp. CBW1006]
MTPPDQLIFCIGLNKTGTTSLLHSFLRLGIRTCDGLADRVERELFPAVPNKAALVETHYADYVAFEDVPWPALFRDLYHRYPQARFIHTTRNPEAWLKSVIAHFGALHDPVHAWIFGSACPVGHDQQWLEVFERHNEAVQEFFTAQPSACYLHLKIDDGTPAEAVSSRLRSFLGYPECPSIWGQVNSLVQRRSPKALAVSLARSLKYRLLGKRSIRLFGITLTNAFTHLM